MEDEGGGIRQRARSIEEEGEEGRNGVRGKLVSKFEIQFLSIVAGIEWKRFNGGGMSFRYCTKVIEI